MSLFPRDLVSNIRVKRVNVSGRGLSLCVSMEVEICRDFVCPAFV